MKLGLVIKQEAERILKNRLQEADSFILVKYSKVSAPDLNILRTSLSEIESYFMVIKNCIGRRILTSCQNMSSFIDGPCGLILVNKDLISTSRIIYNFTKEKQELLEVKAGFSKDRIITKKEIMELSKIQSLSVLHSKVVDKLKSPIFGLVFSLKQIINNLVWVLDQVKEKKK